jgi:hypothetical protein
LKEAIGIAMIKIGAILVVMGTLSLILPFFEGTDEKKISVIIIGVIILVLGIKRYSK